MDKYDYIIIGAGIVGLATAYAILKMKPNVKIVLLEKESKVGFHQTGHNSGVIHAGIYYEPGSLKADLCRKGLQETKEFCKKHSVPFNECGKLIIATNGLEQDRLDALYMRAMANDIDLVRVPKNLLAKLEPNIAGKEALLSSKTAIVDYSLLAYRLSELLLKEGVEIKFNHDVTDIFEDANTVSVKTKNKQFSSERLVVCGGLQSDRLAKIAGIDLDFKIVPFRGEYFRLRNEKNNIVNRLIYPVPDPDLPFLGIHLTPMIGGYVTVGPNAVISFAREGYKKESFSLKDTADFMFNKGFWKMLFKYRQHAIHELYGSISKRSFLKECQKYCPLLSLEDLIPHPSGIRAQAVTKSGTLVHDFIFKQTKRMLHICNAPSPAATSAFPIGKMIAEKCREM